MASVVLFKSKYQLTKIWTGEELPCALAQSLETLLPPCIRYNDYVSSQDKVCLREHLSVPNEAENIGYNRIAKMTSRDL